MALRKSLLLVVAGLSFVFLLQTHLAAQTNAGLRGTIVDKDGAPLPGATVTVSNPSLGVSQGMVTDARGEFRIVPLAPGKGYSLTVSFPGMGKVVQSDIEVVAGRIVSVPITLRPGAELTEKVRVTAIADVVDTEKTTTTTKFSAEFIDALPIIGRNYNDVLTLAPGVSDDDGDGNVNIHGSRDTDVNYLVDGVSTNNPFNGKSGQQLNIDSIQEIEVNTSGADASYGRAQGGFVNIVTKSGGNDFEGNFKFYWRSNIFDGDGAGIDDPRTHGGLGELGLRDLSFNDLQPFVSVSGPILRDKAWYFVTGEYIQIQEPVNALTQAFVRSQYTTRLFGKATWEMSTNHKLVFQATIDPQRYENEFLDSFTAIESGATLKEGGLSLLLKETSVFTPNVFLETTVSHYKSRPETIPTLDADTNGNGILFEDRNHNNFIDATERDAGEDYDGDRVFDVFEDFIEPNGRLDNGEDRDGDMRLTPSARNGIGGGCEGIDREDKDCDGNPDIQNEDADGNGFWDPVNEDTDHDGHWDNINEDLNGNKVLDPGEDRNMNGVWDGKENGWIEDRNGNGNLDDEPVPFDRQEGNQDVPALYPYGRLRPLPRDRDYELSLATLRRSGPYNYSEKGDSGRITLRQDLNIFVPEWHGQHDMKVGGIFEHEQFDVDYTLRPYLFTKAQPPSGANSLIPTIGVQLPTQNFVNNNATSTTVGLYLQDTYKPLPNLTLTVGMRFDREATDSFGYTPFDPAAQRALYDRVWNLAGGERKQDDVFVGNNDGYISRGWCGDPIFQGHGDPCAANPTGNPLIDELNTLSRIAPARLTQHHTATTLVAANLKALFPEAVIHDPISGEDIIDRDLLRDRGAATFQEREAFRLTNNNFAPRVSISWDPWADSKTKVFANWSRFYDKLFLNTVTLEEGPDTIFRYYRVSASGVSGNGTPNNGIGSAIAKAPPSASQIDRGLQTPFSDELTVGIEREVAPEVSLKLTYINKKYRLQLQDRDINHTMRIVNGVPIDLIGQYDPSSSSGASSQRLPDNRPDLYVHNFFFNGIYRLGNFNQADYNGVEVQVTKRLSRKWQMDASYTYARVVGAAEDFISDLGDDPSSQNYEYGYLNYDQRHEVKFNLVTYLPNDWQVASAIQWGSGYPYSVIDRYLALDNYDYPQFRTTFGFVPENPTDKDNDGTLEREFQFVRRNSRRNEPRLNIDLNATKSFVLGKLNSKLFLTIANLLNTDDLRIETYEPSAPNRGGALQLDSQRRFGRRFQVGFQFEF